MSSAQPNPQSGRATHSRDPSSNTAPAKPESKTSKRPAAHLQPETHFTALIRLPFPRGDFVDPLQVDWDASKDKALWKIISRSPKTSDLDWEELASKFQVPHTFMLQQAAWLYERHLSHVRAQMRKFGNVNPTTGSLSSTPVAVGGYAMKRLGSGGASRAPSSLSIRSKDGQRPDSTTPGTPRAVTLSRSPSTNTVTQSRANLPPSSPRQQLHRSFRSAFPSARKSSPIVVGTQPSNNLHRLSSPSPPSATDDLSSSGSSSSSSDEPNPIRSSKIFKRPPRFKSHKPPLSRLDQSTREDDEDVEESSDNDESNTSSLPFANPSSGLPSDPTATLRQGNYEGVTSPRSLDPPLYAAGRDSPGVAAAASQYTRNVSNSGHNIPPTDSSASSGSSAAPTGVFANMRPRSNHGQRAGQTAAGPSGRSSGPLSPRHRAELARLNPHKRGSVASVSSTGSGGAGPSGGIKGKDAEKSDGGTPSMGSSFSDLDDASVTQSALEEALLSNMQHGRMSTLSNLRSRYL